MKRERATRQKLRPRLADKFMLRLSMGRQHDGLWVGTFGTEPDTEFVLRRMEEALLLIKTFDRHRYDRLLRDLERVWARFVFGGLGCYNDSLSACEIDTRFVLDETKSPELIASVIVHEATHARLQRCGIGYQEALRPRVEAVCFRRELAFAAKLPNGEQVRALAEASLAAYADPDYWTNAAFGERHFEGGIRALRHLKTPEWQLRIVRLLHAVIRLARGLTRRVAER